MHDHADRSRGVTAREGLLVLADGTTFEGELVGAPPPGGVATGEVVFNTVLAGYQEVLSDPSYAGQIVTFTYPHIGNYGTNDEDDESRRPLSCASWLGARRAGGRPGASTTTCAPTACPASRASTPAASPGTSARPARCRGPSATPTRRR
jgi:hypothetical protein